MPSNSSVLSIVEMPLLQAVLLSNDEVNLAFLNSFFKLHFPELCIKLSSTDIFGVLNILNSEKLDLIIIDCNYLEEMRGQSIVNLLNELNLEVLVFTNSNLAQITLNVESRIQYLQKPLKIKVLKDQLYRIYRRLSVLSKKFEPNSTTMFENDGTKNKPKFLAVAHEKSIQLLKKVEIQYLKSEGKYTNIHLNSNVKVLSSRNIGEYERQLEDSNFIRIHNSYIVNLNYVEKILKEAGLLCFMKSGDVLPVSRRKKDEIYSRLNLRI